MAREYFKVFHSYLESISLLTYEERGRLFTALLEYSINGEPESLQGNERILYPTFKANIDRDIGSYSDTVERNRENGSKGGRPRKQDGYTETQKTHSVSEKPKKAKTKTEDKEKDKDKDEDKDKSSPPTPPRGQDAFAEFAGDNEILLASLRDFEEMRKKDRHPMTERAKQILVKKLCELSKDVNEQIAILEQSTVSNWKSVYPLKQENQSGGQASQKKETVIDTEWLIAHGVTMV